VERQTEHVEVSKPTSYQHFSSKNDFVGECPRRIDHAGGVPAEQAIDPTGASPRSRALAPR
jgi:AcrR family transcriptional regulator